MAEMDLGTLQAGLAVADGLFNDKSEGWLGKMKRYEADKVQYERQKEFAQHGIQWRVEDAVRAGLHPLFALSGGGAAYAPTSQVNYDRSGQDFASMGQNLLRAVAATQTEDQRAATQTALEVGRSQVRRNDAEAGYFNAQEAKLRGLNPPMPGVSQSVLDDGAYAGRVDVQPGVVESWDPSDRSTTAGVRTGWMRVQLTPHLYAYMPQTNEGWAESWGELGMAERAAIIAANEARQPGFSQRFISEFLMGKAPMPAAREPDPYHVFQLGRSNQEAYDEGRRSTDFYRKSGRERGINWRTGR